MSRGHSPTDDRRLPRRGLGAGLRPLQPAALVAAHDAGWRASTRARGQAQPVDQGAGDRRGARRPGRLPLPQLGRGERYVWEQQIAGTPFERHLRRSRSRSACGPAGRDRGQPHLRAEAARPLAARLADDARRPGQDSLDEALDEASSERGCAYGESSAGRLTPRLEVVGVGRSGDRARARRPRRWRRCASGSGSCSPRRAPAELDDFRAARRRAAAAGAGRRGGRGERLHRTEDRVRHATGCGYVDLARLRGGRLDDAPDAVLLPADAEAVRRVLEVCAGEGVAVVPFGGRHQRGRRGRASARRARAADQPRPRPTARGRGRPLARSRPGSAPACAGPRPKRRWRTRASSSATSPSRSSTRRSAASPRPARPVRPRAGTGASTPLVSAARLVAPVGELRTLETPHTAAGPVPARAGRRLRGRLRRDPRGDGAGAPGSPECAATRPGWPRASRPGRRSSARSPRAPACPT